MGMCPLFEGMRVRLTTKLSAKHLIVQDAVGVVVGVQFDDREFDDPARDWRRNADVRRKLNGYVRLKYVPQGVYVKIDQRGHGFL